MGAAFRTMAMKATHETTTRGPEEVGVSVRLQDTVMEGITVKGNLNWREEGRRLEESKLVRGVGIHGDWITNLKRTREGFIPSGMLEIYYNLLTVPKSLKWRGLS